MRFPRFGLLCATVFFAAGGVSPGQNFEAIEQAPGSQIGWASQAFGTNYMADGVTTFEQSGVSIHFELGSFVAGFDPSTTPMDQWAANWVALEGTDGSSSVTYNNGDQQFIQTSTLPANASPFNLNGQAYIWGYTSKEAETTSQWILLAAPAWKWPDVNGLQPATFSVSDALQQDAIMGFVNFPGGGFHMQLDWVVVPEPSSAMMAMFGTIALVSRRRR